ncbi:MAG: CarD family transcriptional regulator [Phascolarctobacterium sp.]|nr:CarD family transcriptional regulator [Phascolarctobacterium sp.]
MFATGDRVVYPMHGGALIQDIQHREQNGAVVDYYVLKMIFENMTVAIPVANAEKLGLRPIGDEASLESIKSVLQEEQNVQAYKSISWNRRFQLYMDRIKTGSVLEVARIYKVLYLLEQGKKISVGERRLLHTTRQILQSEIMLIKDIDAEQAGSWLTSCCS